MCHLLVQVRCECMMELNHELCFSIFFLAAVQVSWMQLVFELKEIMDLWLLILGVFYVVKLFLTQMEAKKVNCPIWTYYICKRGPSSFLKVKYLNLHHYRAIKLTSM